MTAFDQSDMQSSGIGPKTADPECPLLYRRESGGDANIEIR